MEVSILTVVATLVLAVAVFRRGPRKAIISGKQAKWPLLTALVLMGIYAVFWLFFGVEEITSRYSNGVIYFVRVIMIVVLMFLAWRRPLEGGVVLIILGVLVSLYYVIETMRWGGYFQAVVLLVGMPYVVFGLLFLINRIRWLSENSRYSALVTAGLSLFVLIYLFYILSPWIECGLDGGQYVRSGLGSIYACQYAYSDANNRCSGPEDCQGACVLPYAETYGTSVPRFGKCAENDSPFGCKCYLDYPHIQCSCTD